MVGSFSYGYHKVKIKRMSIYPKELRNCQMCGKPISTHRRCKKCGKLLEEQKNSVTRCVSCNKYHCAISEKDSRYCEECLS